jgi:hypothetical protein
MLNCTREADGEKYTLTRNVELITNCSCVDCNDNVARRVESDEDNNNADDSGEDETPDSLSGNDLPINHHNGHHIHTHEGALPAAATLHKLKSVSAEIHELNQRLDEDTMINDNKIPSDDDDEHDPAILARLERHRASLAGQHDL